ncbi:hypothetical protein [Kribbella kalugense]|uniref:Resolvase-like protein n=1 Tax=Kribbella kalugense TaxID=2512221 RepID=A0A4R7ZWN9_9ACTN|nr:hypothetical protein [Kribbella kalugense]TDW22116.1 hypothetical protein EV650_0949 [Kribbella kalugense]
MTIASGVATEMEPSNKPYVAIYFREHVMMSAGEMARARRDLLSFATRRGFGLEVDLFVEKLETVPDAFARMAKKLSGPGGHVVIVPGIHHLAGLGNPPLAVLQAFTADGVQVLMAGHVE